jgi:hypothetical protein
MADPTWDSTSPIGNTTSTPVAPAPIQQQTPPAPEPTWDSTYDPEERYGTVGQQAITGLEGIGQGLIGPLAPMAERALGVNAQDIAGRAEANPFTKNAGEVAGLIAPLFVTGGVSAGARAAVASGEAAHEAGLLGSLASNATLTGLMTKAGEAATGAWGIANLPKEASFATRVGSNIVRQAAETAVMQMSDDAARLVYADKDAPTSAENAIGNIGLAAALGGAGGAIWTGAISPLWKATVGTRVEEFLKGLKYHLNDEGAINIKDHSGVSTSGVAEVPGASGAAQKITPSAEIRNAARIPITKNTVKDLAKYGADSTSYGITQEGYDEMSDDDSPMRRAINGLGINVPPVMRAAMNGDPKAMQLFNELRESQHPEILAALKDLPSKVDASVASKLGVPLEDAMHYSENQAGKDVYTSFEKEYNDKYAPVAKALEQRDQQAAPIMIGDEVRRDFGGNIIERGMNEVGTDSPYYNTYEHYAQRVMAKDTIGQLDKLKTEIFNKAKSISTDINEKNALNNIRNMISEFQEKQIAQHGVTISKEGLEDAQDIIAQRLAANKQYANFSNMSQTMADHLGVGDFKGAGTLKQKLGGITSEKLLDKFSPEGNADFIPFMQQYFPGTLAKVREVEAKKFLAPSVTNEQGVPALNIKKLNKAIENTQKGSPEYANFVLPKDAQESVQQAQAVLDSIPKIKSSGTAGWISKLTKHLPASALSAVGLLTGHNPIAGYLLGEMAQRLGRDVPNEIKLAYLKFLGADKPIQAEGFKTMVDYLHSAYNGEHSISNAVKNVLKSGAQVLTTSQIPSVQDREKLDKRMTQIQTNPQQNNVNTALGHYMPDHEAASTMASSRAMQYLQTLKPQPTTLGPLDKPIPISKMQEARYNRALDIAQEPRIVLTRIKAGTLQVSDIQDLKAMYPALYDSMAKKLTNELAGYKSEGQIIPYKVRMGISLFLGQPIDSSMQPSSIISAQMTMAAQAPPQSQGKQKKPTTKAGTMMQKGAKSYETANQAAESDRVQGRTD